MIILSVGLLTASVTTTNFLLNRVWAGTNHTPKESQYPLKGIQHEMNPDLVMPTIITVSSLNGVKGICDDSTFISNPLLEKLKDKYCGQYEKSGNKDDKISNKLEIENRITQKLQELKID